MNREEFFSNIDSDGPIETVIEQTHDFINDIESRVADAERCLSSITSVDDIDSVRECLAILKALSKDLY